MAKRHVGQLNRLHVFPPTRGTETDSVMVDAAVANIEYAWPGCTIELSTDLWQPGYERNKDLAERLVRREFWDRLGLHILIRGGTNHRQFGDIGAVIDFVRSLILRPASLYFDGAEEADLIPGEAAGSVANIRKYIGDVIDAMVVRPVTIGASAWNVATDYCNLIGTADIIRDEEASIREAEYIAGLSMPRATAETDTEFTRHNMGRLRAALGSIGFDRRPWVVRDVGWYCNSPLSEPPGTIEEYTMFLNMLIRANAYTRVPIVWTEQARLDELATRGREYLDAMRRANLKMATLPVG